MTSRRAMLATAVLGLALLSTPAHGQAPVHGGLNANQVWTQNVFGTEPSPSDAITEGRAWLAWAPSSSWRASASGRLLRFMDNPALDHGYATVTAEAFPGAKGARTRWQGGLSGTWRMNADLYAPFDYTDTAAYLLARRYLSAGTSVQLRGDVSARTYPGLDDEDARKAWLGARLQKSLPTHTSLTLSARAGWKDYDIAKRTDAAARELAVNAAQSVSARVALRGWWSDTNLYEHGDAAAQMAAFDNPLLDEFSLDGVRAGLSCKVITPWNLTAELSGERTWLDYPGRPPVAYDPLNDKFVLDGTRLLLGSGTRSDASTRLRLAIERHGVRVAGSRVDLDASVEWTDQASNDLYWQWRGLAVQAGASVAF